MVASVFILGLFFKMHNMLKLFLLTFLLFTIVGFAQHLVSPGAISHLHMAPALAPGLTPALAPALVPGHALCFLLLIFLARAGPAWSSNSVSAGRKIQFQLYKSNFRGLGVELWSKSVFIMICLLFFV